MHFQFPSILTTKTRAPQNWMLINIGAVLNLLSVIFIGKKSLHKVCHAAVCLFYSDGYCSVSNLLLYVVGCIASRKIKNIKIQNKFPSFIPTFPPDCSRKRKNLLGLANNYCHAMVHNVLISIMKQ